MIYSFVLKIPYPISIHSNSMRSASADVLPILGSSRLLRAEALPVFYQMNHFETEMTIDPDMKQAISIYITQLPHLHIAPAPGIDRVRMQDIKLCVCIDSLTSLRKKGRRHPSAILHLRVQGQQATVALTGMNGEGKPRLGSHTTELEARVLQVQATLTDIANVS